MLSVENLTVRDGRGVDMVKNVSFNVRAGEIVGIAGVAGNGQSELLQAISGIRRAVTGKVMLQGEPIPCHRHRRSGWIAPSWPGPRSRRPPAHGAGAQVR